MNSNYVVIMAGGVGSRFWPASREARPKQFLDILGLGKSLLRMTFERFTPIIATENIYVVTHEKYLQDILDHLPELTPDQVICEPSRNNTAPCVAYAAYKLMARDPDANIIISPADHIIIKEGVFQDLMDKALDFTRTNDTIVTLGIQPTRPDTGYGYIEMATQRQPGVFKALRFAEKPSLDLATKYLEAGNYVWNSGLFIFRAKTIQDAFASYAPAIDELLSPSNISYNDLQEKDQIAEEYPKTPKISIDYAVMEKAQNIYTMPADIGWSDLGTWKSLFEEADKDDNQSVVQSSSAILLDSTNNLVRAPKGKAIVIKGLSDYIVIDESDVLLIFPKEDEQQIKQIKERVANTLGDRYI